MLVAPGGFAFGYGYFSRNLKTNLVKNVIDEKSKSCYNAYVLDCGVRTIHDGMKWKVTNEQIIISHH